VVIQLPQHPTAKTIAILHSQMVKTVSNFLPSLFFAIHHSLTTVSLDTIVSEAVTASLHKYVLLHTSFRRFRSYQKCTKV